MEIKELYKKFLKAKGASIKHSNLVAGKKIDVSKKGLWDKKKKQVIVPSNRITMKGPNGEQDFFKKPVVATGLQSGQKVMMQPGGEYYFPNDKAVHEVRMQDGGLFAVGDYDKTLAPKKGNYLLPDINRPSYTDDEGQRRSEYRMGRNVDGKEVLMPTVVSGRQLSDDEALERYNKTGLHMGKFNTPEEAEYASKIRTAKYNMLEDPVRFNAGQLQDGGSVQTDITTPAQQKPSPTQDAFNAMLDKYEATKASPEEDASSPEDMGFQLGGDVPVVIDALFSNYRNGIGKKYAQMGMRNVGEPEDDTRVRPADLPPLPEDAGKVNQWLYSKGDARQKRLQAQYDVESAADKEVKYVNSPEYADLLTAEFHGAGKTYDDLGDSEREQIDNILNNRRENLKSLRFEAKDMTKKGVTAGYDPNFHTMYVPRTPVQSGVHSHELSHVGDQAYFRNGINPGVGTKFAEQLDRSAYPKQSPEFLDQPSTLKRNTTVGQNIEEDFNEADYLQDPSEVKARLRALRDSSINQGYKLLEPGYDINKYKKGFSTEEQRQYEQLKKAGLSDDKINEMMYLFAKNQTSEPVVAQNGLYIPPRSNPSTSDNTRVAPQFIDRAQIAKNQQRIAYAQTPEGKAELAATKKRVEADLLKKEQARIQKEKEAKQRKLAEMQARIDDSKKVQDLPIAEQFTPDNLVRGTQAMGDKLRLFGPESPLVTSGLVEADPDSFYDEYLNPAKMLGDMGTDLAVGTRDAIKTGSVKPLLAPVATPLLFGAMGAVGSAGKKAKTVENSANRAAFNRAAPTTRSLYTPEMAPVIRNLNANVAVPSTSRVNLQDVITRINTSPNPQNFIRELNPEELDRIIRRGTTEEAIGAAEVGTASQARKNLYDYSQVPQFDPTDLETAINKNLEQGYGIVSPEFRGTPLRVKLQVNPNDPHNIGILPKYGDNTLGVVEFQQNLRPYWKGSQEGFTEFNKTPGFRKTSDFPYGKVPPETIGPKGTPKYPGLTLGDKSLYQQDFYGSGISGELNKAINEAMKERKLGNILSGGTGHTLEGRTRWDKLVEKGKAVKLGEEDYKLLKRGGNVDHSNDDEMVNGVASILRRVKDKDNRASLANQLSKQFNREKVNYNLSDFLNKSKVK